MALFLFMTLQQAVAQCPDTQDRHTRRIAYNIYGGFLGGAHGFADNDEPYAAHFGFGVSYAIDRHWSVMPALAYRAKFEVGNDSPDVGQYDCSFIDVPVLVQYRPWGQHRSGLVVECGPVFSFRSSGGAYEIYVADHSLSIERQIYKNFDFGFQPGVYCQFGRHWQLGLQSYLGLLNIARQYEGSENFRYRDLVLMLRYHF